MRFEMKLVLALVLIGAGITGCGLFNASQDISDDPVSGHIQTNSFTFVSGYAGESSSYPGVYVLYLFPQEAAAGLDPWDSGAYTDIYPYVDFLFESSLVPGEFTISTYAGIGRDENIGIEGWLGPFDNILFDSGTLVIEVFDLTGGTISGGIIADTRENFAELNGSFTVPIRPAN